MGTGRMTGQQDETVERAIAQIMRAYAREFAAFEEGSRPAAPDAIVYARKAHAALAHLPTPPGRWVPLEPTEALPHEGDRCLVCSNWTYVTMGTREGDAWFNVLGDRLVQITHWMTLPPPPGEPG